MDHVRALLVSRHASVAECSRRTLQSSGECRDVVVLADTNDTVDTLRPLREGLPRAVLLLVCALQSIDIIDVLSCGVDDCIAPSLPTHEIVARILAHARRAAATGPRAPNGHASLWLDVGATVELDVAAQLLRGSAGVVSLTATELRLLQYLANGEHAVRAELLASAVMGRGDVRGRGRDLVYRHVANIRKKLKLVGCPDDVLEQSALGYRLRRRYVTDQNSDLFSTSALFPEVGCPLEGARHRDVTRGVEASCPLSNARHLRGN